MRRQAKNFGYPLAVSSLILLMLTVLVACSVGGGGQTTEAEEGQQAPDEASRSQYPITLVDDDGNSVTIDEKPQRVLSLAPSNTEIICALGATDLLVGVDDFSDWPAEIGDLPRVGGPANLNYEMIADLDPDVVFLIAEGSGTRETLISMGLPVVVLQPRDMQGIYADIALAGKVLDRREAADQVISSMKEAVSEVASALESVRPEDKPRVFFEIWPEPLMTAGPGSFIDALIDLAGGVNIAHDATEAWVTFSRETLVERDPQVIITTFEDSVKELREGTRPGWENIAACREGRIYHVDLNIVSHPSPRLVRGLVEIARVLHPDRFPQGDE